MTATYDQVGRIEDKVERITDTLYRMDDTLDELLDVLKSIDARLAAIQDGEEIDSEEAAQQSEGPRPSETDFLHRVITDR
jgi:hypothetical protein